MKKASMIEHFSIIEDPRIDRRKKHNLIDIIVVAVCGVISSCETWVDIEEYGNTKSEWFKSFLELPNGIPSHDTFGMVNAYATGRGVCLAQLRTDYEKKDEKQGFRDLIDFLYLKGTIVTIDAGGCHSDIASKIANKDADYFLALKNNQKTLLKQVKYLIEQSPKEVDFFEENKKKSHGRIEKRTCYAVDLDEKFINSLEKKCMQRKVPVWKNLRSVCKIISERTIKGEKAIQERYYLFSKKADAEKMNSLARGHWGIENKLHWVLDMAFDEDHCRVRTGYAGENFAVLRQIALNLLKSEKSSKRSIKGKRLKSGWDDKYLLKVLTSTQAII